MRITFITVGSRGDVQPSVALALGLQVAGHQVRLATHTSFEALVRSHGLEFYPVAGDPREMLESEAGREWLESSHNPLLFVQRFARLAEPLFRRALEDCWTAC